MLLGAKSASTQIKASFVAFSFIIASISKSQTGQAAPLNSPRHCGSPTGASKNLQMLPGPPGAWECALRLCKSMLTCSWKILQIWRCIENATRLKTGIVKFWSCCDLSPGLQQDFRVAEISVQVCGRLSEWLRPECKHFGRLGATFSQWWFLQFHNHKASCLSSYTHQIHCITILHVISLWVTPYIHIASVSLQTVFESNLRMTCIRNKCNWFPKMYPINQSFSTFSTNTLRYLLAMFHHSANRSIMWSRHHKISESCLLIYANSMELFLQFGHLDFNHFEGFSELFHYCQEDSYLFNPLRHQLYASLHNSHYQNWDTQSKHSLDFYISLKRLFLTSSQIIFM